MTTKLNNSENVTVPWYQQSELLLSIGLLASLGVMLVPLPTFLLDMLLALNLAQAALLLLITLGTRHPLELSVFPSLLLLLTLFRLTLNIATTRLILLEADAGRIVSTFGSLVVGGNLIVGLVIFLILVIIQFVVITKGSGRISEVAARFTLDALPGKQMAIDAELNAGAITMEVARERRESLARETDFYGSMDGAGKFVRGDAIAGLIIT
ncbi:MAG: FHIPEP family type III secretion protein, partial [Planctomycetaceae bacterium]|nr:FHIPEP family type III secretion protein [Planctomycetaceae bacterium]